MNVTKMHTFYIGLLYKSLFIEDHLNLGKNSEMTVPQIVVFQGEPGIIEGKGIMEGTIIQRVVCFYYLEKKLNKLKIKKKKGKIEHMLLFGTTTVLFLIIYLCKQIL